MVTRGNPPRGTGMGRVGTPARGTGSYQAPPEKPGPLITALVVLAVVQALFFLLPLASAASRLLGVALALGTLLALRIIADPPARRAAAVIGISALTLGNFIAHLIASSPAYPFRAFQLSILFAYSATFLALICVAAGVLTERRSLIAWGSLAAALTVGEMAVGGPETFSAATKTVEWVGLPDGGFVAGSRLPANSVLKTLYPDNPRGYFDEPDALQRRWELIPQQGAVADLEFPLDRPGVIRVSIAHVPDSTAWHLALRQQPLKILAEERYELRFRARADSVRTIFVAVGMAHAPWTVLGLYREERVDTTWREYTQTFRATDTDPVSQLYFNLGAEGASVELMNISLRAISSNTEVEAEARRQLSVSYRLNDQGCRGPAYPTPAAANTWRILSLGDGNSFGIGVHEKDTYAARLDALLNESAAQRDPNARFEVINCGARGLSAMQMRALLDTLGPRYAPNVVLFAVDPADDRPTQNDEFETVAAPTSGAARLFRLWGTVQSLGAPEESPRDYASIVSEVKVADAKARAMGGRLVVVLFQHRRDDAWPALNSAIATGLKGANIPILNLSPVLLAFGDAKLQVHPTIDRHPNELAHRVAAEALRKFLADENLLGQGRATPVVDSTPARP